MGRALRPLDPAAGPVQAFAAELRKLRQQAGDPKYLQMARKTGKSRTALTEAAGGDHLPTWETVAAFLTACGGDIPTWQTRYARVRDELRAVAISTSPDETDISQETVKQAASDAPPSDPSESERPEPGEPELTSRLRRTLPFAATAMVAALIASAVTVVVMNAINSSAERLVAHGQAQRAAVIMVQNKVALGASQLIEDTSPAYLSTQSKPSCASHGCKVPGTEVDSGALLVAVCHVAGTEMFNYNLDSSESKQNPNRADSTLWYRAVFPDGRSGYISEVYIAPADRGGKGLPRCL